MSWLDAFLGGISVASDGAPVPTEPTLNFDASFTVTNDPSNKQNTVSGGGGGGGITALTGDVTASGDGSVAAHVVRLGGTTPGASNVSLPTGNNIVLTGGSAGVLIDTSTAPGFVGIGGPVDGSSSNELLITTSSVVVIGSTDPTGNSGYCDFFAKEFFFSGPDELTTDDARMVISFRTTGIVDILARADQGITSFRHGYVSANTNTDPPGRLEYVAQDAKVGSDDDGGDVNFTAGAGDGTGVSGAVRLRLRGGDANVIVEATEPVQNQRVLALLGTTPITDTQMPANTGDMVIYIANASTVPAADPVGGGILFVEGGALKYRGSAGTVTTLGAP